MDILTKAYLVAPESPKQAWYSLEVYKKPDCFVVAKQSGPKGRVSDSRSWKCSTMQDAVTLFTKKLRDKTKPTNTRVYMLVPRPSSEHMLTLPLTAQRHSQKLPNT